MEGDRGELVLDEFDEDRLRLRFREGIHDFREVLVDVNVADELGGMLDDGMGGDVGDLGLYLEFGEGALW
jgi:hypothetical protein